MARNIECQCTYNFTCGYCLRNAKPYLFTPSKSTFEQAVIREPFGLDMAGELNQAWTPETEES